MRHRGEELALGAAQRLDLREPPGVVDGPLLPLHSLSEVPGNLGKADERSVVVPQRGDDDVRPKPRAVLSYAPSFVLDPPVPLHNLQLPLRLSRALVYFGIE